MPRAHCTRFIVALTFLAALAGCVASSDPGPILSTVVSQVAAVKGPCDRVTVAGGAVVFDLTAHQSDRVGVAWSADAGTFDDAQAWSTTWTAPAEPGVYHVTATFAAAGPEGARSVAWPMNVLATQADVDAFATSCQSSFVPPLTDVAAHTDAASGLTVHLLASTTHVAHDGHLWADLSVSNDGAQDASYLDCGSNLSFHLYLRTSDGAAIGELTCDGPGVVCDDSLAKVIQPGESSGRLAGMHVVDFSGTRECAAGAGGVGIGTNHGDGTYELVAAVDVPPRAAHQDVETSATITVGP